MESGLTAGLPALRPASFFACRQPPFSGRGAAAVASPLVSIATSAYLPLTLVPNCLITYLPPPTTPQPQLQSFLRAGSMASFAYHHMALGSVSIT